MLVAHPAGQQLVVDVQLQGHAVEVEWLLVGVLHPQDHGNAHFQALAGQRFQADQVDVQRVARDQRGAAGQDQAEQGAE
ncbi:hypothetical protein D3C84_978060 [compost metagenome]